MTATRSWEKPTLNFRIDTRTKVLPAEKDGAPFRGAYSIWRLTPCVTRELWRAGAVPMGGYTTETAVARFLAASIIADSEEELAELMDDVNSDNSGE